MALKSLSVDKLLKLKSEVEAALASKVREQRRELELELSKLDRFQGVGRVEGLGVLEELSPLSTAILKIPPRPGPAAGYSLVGWRRR